MIAYEELAAALERWRIRNGLPGTPPLFADGPRKPVAASVAQAAYATPAAAAYAAPAAPAYAAPAAPAYVAPAAAAYAPPPAPRPAPPIAPPPAETIDDDVDVLDEDHLDNDGPDFAMSFDSGAAKRPALSADDAHEASQIGGTDPGIIPAADDEDEGDDVWPEAASYASPPASKPAAAVVDDDDDGGTLVNG